MEVTKDSILNGAIELYQPKHGYRVAIDPILLSSVVALKNNQTILDVGCGVGTISLILKYLNRSQQVTSLDIDPKMANLCEKNSKLNNLPLTVINEAIDNNLLKQENFDCIVTNPPFYNPCKFRSSQTKLKANFETIKLSDWISFCLKRLKPKGNFYIIHITEKLNEILESINTVTGRTEIIPIYSYQNQSAIRVIVKCKKGSKEPLKILPSIVSHTETGEYSNNLQQILNGNFSKINWIKTK